jgi:hypothetical protein
MPGGGTVDNKFISVKNGGGNIRHSDRRCRRPDCIFPKPTIRFDLEGHRAVAAWNWLGVGVVNDANRVKISVMPTMLLVSVSYN